MSAGRSYAGESAAERTERRRRQLLDAGLEVIGTVGYRGATVRGVCREAHVADRNFYEYFDSTEDLLLAVYAECTGRLERTAERVLEELPPDVDAVGGARAMLDAFLTIVEDDPRLARVVWLEVLGVSPRVERAYMSRMEDLGRLIGALAWRDDLLAVDPGPRRALIEISAAGAVTHSVMAWVTGGYVTPRAELVHVLAALLVAIAGAEYR